MFHVCVGSSPQAFFSFLCPNGTVFHEKYSICDWWFNVDCNQQLDKLSPSSSDSSVRIDTIYSALHQANEKYETLRNRNLGPVTQSLTTELNTSRRKRNFDDEERESIVKGNRAGRHKPRYKQNPSNFL